MASRRDLIATAFVGFSIARLKLLAWSLDARPSDSRSRASIIGAIAKSVARSDGYSLAKALTIVELRTILASLGQVPGGTKRRPLVERLRIQLRFASETVLPEALRTDDPPTFDERPVSLPSAPSGAVVPLTDEIKADLLEREESQFFDRKQIEIKPAKLSVHIVAFANGEGGRLLVGATDGKQSSRTLAGFASQEDANAHVQQLYFGGSSRITVGHLQHFEAAPAGTRR